VHSNNAYLEVLAGCGVIGAAALLWLMVVVARSIGALWRVATDARLPLVAAATAACAAIAVHGLVDSFVTFTPTYVAFAIAAGLLFSPSAQGETCA
jgi:O-antigen ligase